MSTPVTATLAKNTSSYSTNPTISPASTPGTALILPSSQATATPARAKSAR